MITQAKENEKKSSSERFSGDQYTTDERISK